MSMKIALYYEILKKILRLFFINLNMKYAFYYLEINLD